VAHDGSEGLSPDGWLPDRISVGVLTRVFTPELVDGAVDAAGAREQRRRLLPARLVMYFVLALWLYRGRNCGYGQVMAKLADGLYHQRRGADLLAGQLDADGWADAGGGRRWRQPDISSLARGRGKLGPAPVRFLFEQVAGPTGDMDCPGVPCCGLRVVSMNGSTTDVPDSTANDEFFGRPSNQSKDGAFPQVRWLAAAESGTGSLLGAAIGPYRAPEQALAAELLESGCFGPGMLVLADRKFLFAVYQALCKVIGIGAAAAGIPPAKISFPHALQAATDTVAAFPPDQADLALATFLLKILAPRHLRPRPPGPQQPPQDQESRRLPRAQTRGTQRHQRHPEDTVPPARPMADHLTQGHCPEDPGEVSLENPAPAAEEGATAAEGAGSGGTVQIFRNVDAREFDSIATTGRLSTGARQMEGKWFATQGAHAEQWGQLLNGGEGITVETRIPASVADQLYLHAGKLDGIGPAYYADANQLDLINETMHGIRAWP
jgi:hypothetical protein